MTESEFITEIKWLSWEIRCITHMAKELEDPAKDGGLQSRAMKVMGLMEEHEGDFFAFFRKIHIEESSRPTPELKRLSGILREYSDQLTAVPCFFEDQDKWKTIEDESGCKNVVEKEAPQSRIIPLPAEILRDKAISWNEELFFCFPDLQNTQKEGELGLSNNGVGNNTAGGLNKSEIGLNWRKFLEAQQEFKAEIGVGGLMSKAFVLNDGIRRNELAEWLLGNEWFYERNKPQWKKIDGLFVDSAGKTIEGENLMKLATHYKFKKIVKDEVKGKAN